MPRSLGGYSGHGNVLGLMCGELAAAVAAGVIGREDVTELGAVLGETAHGRRSPEEITIFDSTGLAIQDLAIAIAAFERAGELDLTQLDL